MKILIANSALMHIEGRCERAANTQSVHIKYGKNIPRLFSHI